MVATSFIKMVACSRMGDILNITGNDVKISLYPFHICFSRPKSPLQKLAAAFVNLDETINTSRDRDCFLYLLKQMYNIYWPNEEYRTRRMPPKTVFFRAILELGAKMCAADGATGRDELAALRSHFGLTSETFPDAGAVFNEALHSNEDTEAIARRIKAQTTGQRDLLEYILIGLAKIAAADGSCDANEHKTLLAAAAAFGFSSNDLDHILALLGIRPQFGQKKDDQRVKSSEEYHLAVLGLRVGADFTSIRAAYRRLARQHHPDHLQACGVPLDKIKHSEEILKRINISYEWLMKRRNAA